MREQLERSLGEWRELEEEFRQLQVSGGRRDPAGHRGASPACADAASPALPRAALAGSASHRDAGPAPARPARQERDRGSSRPAASPGRLGGSSRRCGRAPPSPRCGRGVPARSGDPVHPSLHGPAHGPCPATRTGQPRPSPGRAPGPSEDAPGCGAAVPVAGERMEKGDAVRLCCKEQCGQRLSRQHLLAESDFPWWDTPGPSAVFPSCKSALRDGRVSEWGPRAVLQDAFTSRNLPFLPCLSSALHLHTCLKS